MFKVIALLSKKAGLSREKFIEYYETKHVPLIRSLLPGIREYRRSFVDLNGAIIAPGTTAPDFDVLTELWFDDRKSYEEMLAIFSGPNVGPRIGADEENFLDRSKTRFVVVDEYGVLPDTI